MSFLIPPLIAEIVRNAEGEKSQARSRRAVLLSIVIQLFRITHVKRVKSEKHVVNLQVHKTDNFTFYISTISDKKLNGAIKLNLTFFL